MRFGTTSLMLLSAAVLGTAVVAEVRYGAMDALAMAFGDRTHATGARLLPADVRSPLGEVPALASLASMEATRERPLFFPERRYPEPVVQKAPLLPTKSAKGPAGVLKATLGPTKLSAIVIVNDERVALIQEGGVAKSRQMRIGDVINDWKLTEIRTDSVLFTGGDKSEELKLRSFDPEIAPVPQTRRTGARRAAPGRNSRSKSQVRPRPRTRAQSSAQARSDAGEAILRASSGAANPTPRTNNRARSRPKAGSDRDRTKPPREGDCGLSRC